MSRFGHRVAAIPPVLLVDSDVRHCGPATNTACVAIRKLDLRRPISTSGSLVILHIRTLHIAALTVQYRAVAERSAGIYVVAKREPRIVSGADAGLRVHDVAAGTDVGATDRCGGPDREIATFDQLATHGLRRISSARVAQSARGIVIRPSLDVPVQEIVASFRPAVLCFRNPKSVTLSILGRPRTLR